MKNQYVAEKVTEPAQLGIQPCQIGSEHFNHKLQPQRVSTILLHQP
jgi:hypothetical protein